MQDLYGSHTVCVSARPARENEGLELRAMCMDTAGTPTQPYTVWEPYISCTDTLPLDYDSCAKGKVREKSGRSSVVLRTLPVLQFRGSGSSVL